MRGLVPPLPRIGTFSLLLVVFQSNMITVISDTIKYATMLASCYFSFCKLLPQKLRVIDVLFIPLFIAFGLGGYFVNLYCDYLTCVYLVAVNLATVALRYREPIYETITLGIISYGVGVCAFLVALIISTPINIIVYYFIKNNELNNFIKIQIINIIHLTATILIFQIKRFRNGLSPKNSKYSFDLLLFLSSACIVAMTLFYANAIKLTTATIIVLCIVVCGLLLLFFWRRHVTASYEENVKGRETEINEKSVEFYERQNEELKRQNDELANVIHRDNKLLAALEADGALSGDLKELYRDRKDVLENYRKEDGRVPQTGINALDAVIGYLINRAEGEGIALTFKSSPAAARALCSKIYLSLIHI